MSKENEMESTIGSIVITLSGIKNKEKQPLTCSPTSLQHEEKYFYPVNTLFTISFHTHSCFSVSKLVLSFCNLTKKCSNSSDLLIPRMEYQTNSNEVIGDES